MHDASQLPVKDHVMQQSANTNGLLVPWVLICYICLHACTWFSLVQNSRTARGWVEKYFHPLWPVSCQHVMVSLNAGCVRDATCNNNPKVQQDNKHGIMLRCCDCWASCCPQPRTQLSTMAVCETVRTASTKNQAMVLLARVCWCHCTAIMLTKGPCQHTRAVTSAICETKGQDSPTCLC